MKSTLYDDCPYYHDKNQKTATLYDLQEVRQDGKKPAYIISESPNNKELGFETWQIRDGVAQDAANAIREAHGYKAGEVDFYQQRPDGNFDRVSFREIGRDGQSAADQGRLADQPSAAKPAATKDQTPQWGENQRTLYTPEEVEKSVGAQVIAPSETPQQIQESLNQQYKDLTLPYIDRAAEQKADVQRNQEQTQQMDQHKNDQSHGMDL